ncbi:hypothetical protein SISSUDRAFT_1126978 [Sistotremastrum suecicum HHB10207 ss-3]|uniref:tRNA-splicing endonuclease subunit Sen54 N-terminal domain-containing protein n=1 Tax=Sistotremastrum suecicum HHB10207 ss-3 TaxID=1314776 RepID=A0A166FLR7_9AGAM|nr:hypothetical protein SISSUDRAFT_1126978 [Sistotremastrum suecicum HHB10207 ss-3]
MDDNLEPTSSLTADPRNHAVGDVSNTNYTADEEDEEVPDWTKFASIAGITPSSPAASSLDISSAAYTAGARSKTKNSTSTVIPKRGEKDFEPKTKPSNPLDDAEDSRSRSGPSTGSGLQNHALERARRAMFSALNGTRGTSSKNISYGIWHPHLNRVEVIQAKGILWNAMGHSAPIRTCLCSEEYSLDDLKASRSQAVEETRGKKRTELLPEEALYLMERGSMICFKHSPSPSLHLAPSTSTPTLMPFAISSLPSADAPPLINSASSSFSFDPLGNEPPGAPMTVQHAWGEMIGSESLTLEKYQVYSYLRRLGYVVTRHRKPSSSPWYPIPEIGDAQSTAKAAPASSRGLRASVATLVSSPFWWLWGLFESMWYDPWRPLRGKWRWIHTYPSLLSSLRALPSASSRPLTSSPIPPPASTIPTSVSKRMAGSNQASHPPAPTVSPYEIFYSLYKPSTSFRKSAPPPPDFYLVVVDARTTSIPSLFDLERLWSQIPETRLQASISRKMMAAKREDARKEKIALRQRQSAAMKKGATKVDDEKAEFDGEDRDNEGGRSGLLAWFRSVFVRGRNGEEETKDKMKDGKDLLQPRPPHPFAVLKAGRKLVVIAVVDSGNIGFYRFSEGVFDEMPMM